MGGGVFLHVEQTVDHARRGLGRCADAEPARDRRAQARKVEMLALDGGGSQRFGFPDARLHTARLVGAKRLQQTENFALRAACGRQGGRQQLRVMAEVGPSGGSPDPIDHEAYCNTLRIIT